MEVLQGIKRAMQISNIIQIIKTIIMILFCVLCLIGIIILYRVIASFDLSGLESDNPANGLIAVLGIFGTIGGAMLAGIVIALWLIILVACLINLFIAWFGVHNCKILFQKKEIGSKSKTTRIVVADSILKMVVSGMETTILTWYCVSGIVVNESLKEIAVFLFLLISDVIILISVLYCLITFVFQAHKIQWQDVP